MAVVSSYAEELDRAFGRIGESFWVTSGPGEPDLLDGRARMRLESEEGAGLEIASCPMENLGDREFLRTHGVQYPCMSGAMANGISSVEIVEAMGRSGFMGIFGAAGLPGDVVARAVDRLSRSLGEDRPYGVNLIHSPAEPSMEEGTVDLLLKRRVRLAEASAYLNLTLPVVRYRVSGLYQDGSGRVIAPNRVIAKVSRVEVASRFMAPPPVAMVRQLVDQGAISAEQAEWSQRIPMAEDVTAEADSGGHTDNQPAIALLPTMLALRDRVQAERHYERPIRIGAAGGISTPWAAAAAFAMGAAYVVTGSVNQSCVEAGTSEVVRRMLADARQSDVAMAPAADMFEMGVKVQVLKRGTLFAMRAAKLYEIYRTHAGLEQIPAAERASLEKSVFRAPLESIWEQTVAYFQRRDPSRIERTAGDPKQKMALVFRWYLGMSSQWANSGEATREVDYQVWCGPAMAAFNDWVRGTFLELAENRRVADVALNLLYGAAVLTRARMFSLRGLALPTGVPRLAPLDAREIENRSYTN